MHYASRIRVRMAGNALQPVNSTIHSVTSSRSSVNAQLATMVKPVTVSKTGCLLCLLHKSYVLYEAIMRIRLYHGY